MNATATNGVSRLQILNCTQSWVDAKMPYCQCNGPDECCGNCPYCGTHRCDCSGFVSYCWGLPYGRTTWTLPEVAYPITKDELRPGDIMLWVEDHVAFFIGWTDASKTYYYVTQEPGCGIYPNFAYTDVTVYPMNWEPDNFKPYRYNAVSDINALAFTIAVNEPAFDCVKQSGYNVVSPRLYSQGQCDLIGMQNVKIARGVGFGFMPIVEPSPLNNTVNATVQMDQAVYCGRLSGLPADQVYWLAVRKDHGWPQDCHTAGAYLFLLLGRLGAYSATVGVVTSAADWNAIFCPSEQQAILKQMQQLGVSVVRQPHPREAEIPAPSPASALELDIARRLGGAAHSASEKLGGPNGPPALWYINTDGVAGYTGFQPFGPYGAGFTPFAKVYALATVCNIPSAVSFGLF